MGTLTWLGLEGGPREEASFVHSRAAPADLSLANTQSDSPLHVGARATAEIPRWNPEWRSASGGDGGRSEVAGRGQT